jgi:hypothetical protein
MEISQRVLIILEGTGKNLNRIMSVTLRTGEMETDLQMDLT